MRRQSSVVYYKASVIPDRRILDHQDKADLFSDSLPKKKRRGTTRSTKMRAGLFPRFFSDGFWLHQGIQQSCAVLHCFAMEKYLKMVCFCERSHKVNREKCTSDGRRDFFAGIFVFATYRAQKKVERVDNSERKCSLFPLLPSPSPDGDKKTSR